MPIKCRVSCNKTQSPCGSQPDNVALSSLFGVRQLGHGSIPWEKIKSIGED